jgi:hypothetical protein
MASISAAEYERRRRPCAVLREEYVRTSTTSLSIWNGSDWTVVYLVNAI